MAKKAYFNQRDIGNIRKFLTGKKLEKFDKGIALLEEQLKNDNWIEGKGKSKTARACFNKLFPELEASRSFNQLLTEGYVFEPKKNEYSLDEEIDHQLWQQRQPFPYYRMRFKPTEAFIKSWARVVEQKDKAIEYLDEKYPTQVLTKFKLSPKVTKTLKEMNLEIDLSTLVLAKTKTKYERVLDEALKPIFVYTYTSKGTTKAPLKIPYQVVVWRKGVKLNKSRFSNRNGCEACGKHIPSYSFAAIEAYDKKSKKWVGLWLGLDCARNVFGVKSKGVDRPGFVNPKKEAAARKAAKWQRLECT